MNAVSAKAMAVIGVAALPLSGCGGSSGGANSAATTPPPSPSATAPDLAQAEAGCKSHLYVYTSEDYSLTLGDQDKTLVVYANAKTKSGTVPSAVSECVFGVLDTPLAIRSQVAATSGNQGRQTADANGLNYSWTYNANSGLDMIITRS